MILQLFAIPLMVKMLIETEKPFLCAGLYTFLFSLIGFFGLVLTGQASIFLWLVMTAMRFGVSSLYCWLLTIISRHYLWWTTLVIGAFVLILL